MIGRQSSESLTVFLVRLRPDFALGHLNLGVALARRGRLGEAQAQFYETLRLDPKNSSAQNHLDSILEIERQRTKP